MEPVAGETLFGTVPRAATRGRARCRRGPRPSAGKPGVVATATRGSLAAVALWCGVRPYTTGRDARHHPERLWYPISDVLGGAWCDQPPPSWGGRYGPARGVADESGEAVHLIGPPLLGARSRARRPFLRVRDGQDHHEGQGGTSEHGERPRRSSVSGARSMHFMDSPGPRPREGMMPRIDTRCRRDAHQGVGLGPWLGQVG